MSVFFFKRTYFNNFLIIFLLSRYIWLESFFLKKAHLRKKTMYSKVFLGFEKHKKKLEKIHYPMLYINEKTKFFRINCVNINDFQVPY